MALKRLSNQNIVGLRFRIDQNPLWISLGSMGPLVRVQKQQIQITFPITRVDWGQIYTLLRLPIYISHGPMCPMPSMKREFEHAQPKYTFVVLSVFESQICNTFFIIYRIFQHQIKIVKNRRGNSLFRRIVLTYGEKNCFSY